MGHTALFMAAGQGQEASCLALVERGADVNRRTKRGSTVLMTAAYNVHASLVRRLLSLGADHTVVASGGLYEGKTALDLVTAKFEGYSKGPSETWEARRRKEEEAAAVLREWAAAHP